MAWDGVERRKKPRKLWQIGVERRITVGEIIAVIMFFGGLFGAFKELEAKTTLLEQRLVRLERLLCHSLQGKDGTMPLDCYMSGDKR